MRQRSFSTHRAFRAAISAAAFFVAIDRLPAPVQEIPESPTPTIAESTKTSTKALRKSKAVESESKIKSTSKPAPTVVRPKFAGQWKGTLNGAANGAVVTIIVSPAEDSATVQGLPVWGDRRGRATAHGNTLSWPFMAESWTMTVAPDGKTATVTGHHWPTGSSSGTLERLP